MTCLRRFAGSAGLVKASIPAEHCAASLQPLTQLGSIIIVAPHPDDETLGCGGLIAACADLQLPLQIVSVTNGEGSHPHSSQWNSKRLAQLRRREQYQALRALGLKSPAIHHCNLADGKVGRQPRHVMSKVRTQIVESVSQSDNAALFVTSPDDNHSDHQACARLVNSIKQNYRRIQVFYYTIWPSASWSSHKQGKLATEQWHLDIRPALRRKKNAILSFKSQRGLVIKDDPEGFCMTRELLQRSLRPRESYRQVR